MVLWLILIAYFAVMVGIGIYCRSKTKNVSDFVLGGRGLGAWFTAFAFGTSYFSAVVFIGYAGQFGYNYGVSATWIGIGNALVGSLLCFLIMGNRTRMMSKNLQASTMPQFFEKRYNSLKLKSVAAVIVFVFLIPYTASVYNGLSRLFEMAFGIDYTFCIIAMAVLTAVYVILGGYMATAVNDFVQGIIMLFGIIAVVVCALTEQGGFFTALKGLAEINDGVPLNSLSSIIGPDPINLLGVVILTSLGTWGLPQMVHKFYTIKDKKSVNRGAVISTIFALVVAGGSYFLGGFGRLFVTKEEITIKGALAFDTIIPKVLETALPDILMGIVVVLVLSASMSTLSSLVLTSSSTLILDIIKPKILEKSKKSEKSAEKPEKTIILLIRVFIAVFLLISVIIALNPNTYISTLMSISWGALAGAFLAPFLYGLFSKRITKPAVWASFISGVGITVAHMILFSLGLFPSLVTAVKSLNCPLNLLSPINAGAFAMIFGLILVPVVSRFTKVEDKEYVNAIFNDIKKENELATEQKLTANKK